LQVHPQTCRKVGLVLKSEEDRKEKGSSELKASRQRTWYDQHFYASAHMRATFLTSAQLTGMVQMMSKCKKHKWIKDILWAKTCGIKFILANQKCEKCGELRLKK